MGVEKATNINMDVGKMKLRDILDVGKMKLRDLFEDERISCFGGCKLYYLFLYILIIDFLVYNWYTLRHGFFSFNKWSWQNKNYSTSGQQWMVKYTFWMMWKSSKLKYIWSQRMRKSRWVCWCLSKGFCFSDTTVTRFHCPMLRKRKRWRVIPR